MIASSSFPCPCCFAFLSILIPHTIPFIATYALQDRGVMSEAVDEVNPMDDDDDHQEEDDPVILVETEGSSGG